MLEAAIKACCRALFFREQSCCSPSAIHSSSSRYWIISVCPRKAAWTRAHWPLLSTWSTWQKYRTLEITAQKQKICFTSQTRGLLGLTFIQVAAHPACNYLHVKSTIDTENLWKKVLTLAPLLHSSMTSPVCPAAAEKQRGLMPLSDTTSRLAPNSKSKEAISRWPRWHWMQRIGALFRTSVR